MSEPVLNADQQREAGSVDGLSLWERVERLEAEVFKHLDPASNTETVDELSTEPPVVNQPVQDAPQAQENPGVVSAQETPAEQSTGDNQGTVTNS